MLHAAGVPMGAMLGGQWRGFAGQFPPSALICQYGSVAVLAPPGLKAQHNIAQGIALGTRASPNFMAG